MVALLEMPSRSSGHKFPVVPPMNYERRIFERKEVQMRVQAMRLDHSLPALRQPHVSMSVRDLSIGGWSTPSPPPPPTPGPLTPLFPPPPPQPRLDAPRSGPPDGPPRP